MSRSTPIRILAALLSAVLAGGLFFAPSPAVAEEPLMHYAIPTFTVYGGGWGHGIGLSQYGAEGYSTIAGWNAQQIVTHYYQGTQLRTLESLGEHPNPYVKVNIDKDKVARNYWILRGYESKLRVTDGSKTVELAADAYHTFRGTGGSVYVDHDHDGNYDSGEPKFSGTVTVEAMTGSPRLIVVKDPSGPVLNPSYPNGYPYMRYRGRMRLSIASGSTYKLTAVNILPLEQYLYGVVPREMPSSWSPEALKAQAIAARSYAWATNPPSSPGDDELSGVLSCTAASQVYGAHSRLSGGTIVLHETANDEVKATKGQVVYYAPTDTVVTAYFSSSTGGATANIEDVWVTASPKPYYTGVPDPYDYVHGNPYVSWSKQFTGLDLAKKLADSSYTDAPPGAGTSVWVTGVSIERGPSGYPKWTTFRFSNGASTKESSWDVRQALSLRSPNFLFAAVPVDRIYGTDRYLTALEIAKRAFPSSAPAAVVARGDDFADALVGSAVAGAAGGPLLLSSRDSIPSSVLAYLASLGPSKVYLMGGTGALSEAVEAAIRNATNANIVRVDGKDRYETSAEAAREVEKFGGASRVIIASGVSWPDAASASGLAWSQEYPILLTRQDSLPDAVREVLGEIGPNKLIVVGGDGVVGPGTRQAALNAAGLSGSDLIWLRGPDRYTTSAEVARYTVSSAGFDQSTLYLATGELFADVLAGGTISGSEGHPVVLTLGTGLKPGTEQLLSEWAGDIDTLGVLGGPNAIGAGCIDAAQAVLAE